MINSFVCFLIFWLNWKRFLIFGILLMIGIFCIRLFEVFLISLFIMIVCLVFVIIVVWVVMILICGDWIMLLFVLIEIGILFFLVFMEFFVVFIFMIIKLFGEICGVICNRIFMFINLIVFVWLKLLSDVLVM